MWLFLKGVDAAGNACPSLHVAVGSSSRTARSTSISELAKKLAEPKKKSDSLIVPFVLIMVFFGA